MYERLSELTRVVKAIWEENGRERLVRIYVSGRRDTLSQASWLIGEWIRYDFSYSISRRII